MTIPDYQTTMLPLLRAAGEAGRPVGVIELQPKLAAEFKLTDDELAKRLPSGKQGVFHNRLHWAKFYLERAGLLKAVKRGQFEITDRGRALLKTAPTTIDNSVLDQYPEFAAFRQRVKVDATPAAGDAPEAPAVATPEDRIDAARRELDAKLKAEILDRVRQMDPGDFEELIIALLLGMVSFNAQRLTLVQPAKPLVIDQSGQAGGDGGAGENGAQGPQGPEGRAATWKEVNQGDWFMTCKTPPGNGGPGGTGLIGGDGGQPGDGGGGGQVSVTLAHGNPAVLVKVTVDGGEGGIGGSRGGGGPPGPPGPPGVNHSDCPPASPGPPGSTGPGGTDRTGIHGNRGHLGVAVIRNAPLVAGMMSVNPLPPRRGAQ